MDRGTLLKWTLVTGGMAPDQGAVIVAAIAGVVLLATKLWLPGLGMSWPQRSGTQLSFGGS